MTCSSVRAVSVLGLAALLALSSACRATMARSKMASPGRPDFMVAADALGAVPSEAGVAAEPAPLTTNAAARAIIYDGALTLTVPNTEAALESIRKLAESLGGHLQAMTACAITVRVPASAFSLAIARIEALGDVTDRSVTGSDVTEELVDLDIRLGTLETMRTRLLALLEKGGDVKDLLAIEQELQRVIESIELIKGKTRRLQDLVALSTVTVTVNSPLPQEKLADVIPFPWVRNLGSEVKLEETSLFSSPRASRPWIRAELPPGFVKIYEEKGYTRAVSGEGVALLLKRMPNYPGADLGFWERVTRRWLSAGQALSLAEPAELPLAGGAKALLWAGSQEVGRRPCTYLLALAATRDHVYTCEVWGREELVAGHRAALEAFIRGLPIRP